MNSADRFNQRADGKLPGHLGIVITRVDQGLVEASMTVRETLMAPNGFLHAGSLVTLADTAAGCGCINHLPEGASGFTTVELKTNHLGTALDGTIDCIARAVHLGRTTQVWDAQALHRESGRTLVLFRCTQMILYPKPST